jgi:hypothetical protein
VRNALSGVAAALFCACGSGNSPAPTTTVTLAISANFPSRITVDSTNAYWMDLAGMIETVGLTGGFPATLVASNAGSYAIDSTNLYWTDTSAGTVMKVPLSGGASVTLASSALAREIAVDATSVYWAAADPNADGFCIFKVGLDGGTPTTLVSGLHDVPQRIRVDSTSVYWAFIFSGDMSKVDLNGGTPTTLATGVIVLDMAIDSTSIYWTDFTGTVSKLGLSGGSPVALALSQAPPAHGIAVDSTGVYWTTQSEQVWDGCSTTACQVGLLQKTGLAGGTAATLASGAQPWSIAVDSTSVYWTDTSAGLVLKAPK